MSIAKPSTLEDEYFVREDAERIRQLHFQEARKLQEHEKEERRQLHQGHCPECGMLLVPEKIGEVVLHHCPSCGGAFLPRSSWDVLHKADERHPIVEAVLNWFGSVAVKP